MCWFWPGLGSLLQQPGCRAWMLLYPTSPHCQEWREGAPSGRVSLADGAIHQVLLVVGGFWCKLFLSCTLHHPYCCCYCPGKLFLSQTMIFCVSNYPLQSPAEGGGSWGASKWNAQVVWRISVGPLN